MSAFPPPGASNPFEAPATPVGTPSLGETIADAELIRRSYLRHESAVRSLGLVSYILAALLVGLGLVLGLAALRLVPVMTRGIAPEQVATITAAVAGILLVMALVALGVGAGLRRLQPWARWTTVVLVGISFLSYIGRYALALTGLTRFIDKPGQVAGNTILAILSGYVLVVVLSSRTGMVTSSEYRQVVRQTPEIRPYLSMLAKLVFTVVIGFFALVALAILFSAR